MEIVYDGDAERRLMPGDLVSFRWNRYTEERGYEGMMYIGRQGDLLHCVHPHHGKRHHIFTFTTSGSGCLLMLADDHRKETDG